MMKSGLTFLFLVLILIISLQAGEYQSRALIQAKWGNADSEFGLQLEAEGNCPQALAVADDGSLVILDPVNQRVQMFSHDGKWIGQFAIASGIFDIGFQRDQVVVLAPYDYFVARYSRDGKYIEKMNINRQITLIDGLRIGAEAIGIQTLEQVQYSISESSLVQQIESAKQGIGTRIAGMKIRTQWIDPHQGKIIIEDEASGKIQSITVANQDELGSLVVLDCDMNGNVFLKKELFSADGSPYFEVAKFDRNGALQATIRIEHENIVMPFKPITIDSQGNVYFLEIKSDRFSVIQWQEK